jgi:recombination protein RecA
MYGQGISKEGSVLDVAVNNDIVLKSGAWFSYGDTRIGQGRENSKQYLKDNPELLKELDDKIREMFNLGKSKALPAAADEALSDDEL